MARYTPLLVSLRGKLGANVFERGLRVHAYQPGEHTTDEKWSNAFAALSKQWPSSDVEYKGLCHSKYRHGTPQGGLVRQVPYMVQASASLLDNGYNTRDMLCPSVVDALPGESGYEYRLETASVAGRWFADHFNIRIWQVAGAWVEDPCYICYLLIDATVGVEGHDEINMVQEWKGVQQIPLPEPEGVGKSYFIRDYRYPQSAIGYRSTYWCGFIYQVEPGSGNVYIKVGFRGNTRVTAPE